MDLLHKRYSNIDFIFEMEPEEALSFVSYVMERREDELLFQRWINGLQYEISFEEFRLRLKPKKVKPDVEILADVRTILNGFAEERGELHGNI